MEISICSVSSSQPLPSSSNLFPLSDWCLNCLQREESFRRLNSILSDSFDTRVPTIISSVPSFSFSISFVFSDWRVWSCILCPRYHLSHQGGHWYLEHSFLLSQQVLECYRSRRHWGILPRNLPLTTVYFSCRLPVSSSPSVARILLVLESINCWMYCILALPLETQIHSERTLFLSHGWCRQCWEYVQQHCSPSPLLRMDKSNRYPSIP